MKNYLFVYNMIIRLYIPYFQDVPAKFQLSEFKIIKLSSFEDDKFGAKLKRKLCYLHVTSVFEDSENLSDMLSDSRPKSVGHTQKLSECPAVPTIFVITDTV